MDWTNQVRLSNTPSRVYLRLRSSNLASLLAIDQLCSRQLALMLTFILHFPQGFPGKAQANSIGILWLRRVKQWTDHSTVGTNDKLSIVNAIEARLASITRGRHVGISENSLPCFFGSSKGPLHSWFNLNIGDVAGRGRRRLMLSRLRVLRLAMIWRGESFAVRLVVSDKNGS